MLTYQKSCSYLYSKTSKVQPLYTTPHLTAPNTDYRLKKRRRLFPCWATGERSRANTDYGRMMTIVWIHLNVTKVISKFMDEKFRNCVYFFTCILPDYMAHDIPKEFWKNIYISKIGQLVFFWCVRTHFGEK